VLIVLPACGGAPTQQAVPAATAQPGPTKAAPTVQPTPVIAKTATALPTPTETQVATSTPKPTEVPTATSTALPPTATPIPLTPTQAQPTFAPQPTAKPTATLAPTSGSTAPLGPGLASADVKLNLERRGFKCSAASERQGIISGTCDKAVGADTYHLEWYGRNLMQLDFLDATAVVGSGEAAKARATEFLALIATFHFDAAQEAKAWVVATMPLVGTPGVVKETTIAGVHFKLFGGPGAYALEMGTLY